MHENNYRKYVEPALLDSAPILTGMFRVALRDKFGDGWFDEVSRELGDKYDPALETEEWNFESCLKLVAWATDKVLPETSEDDRIEVRDDAHKLIKLRNQRGGHNIKKEITLTQCKKALAQISNICEVCGTVPPSIQELEKLLSQESQAKRTDGDNSQATEIPEMSETEFKEERKLESAAGHQQSARKLRKISPKRADRTAFDMAPPEATNPDIKQHETASDLLGTPVSGMIVQPLVRRSESSETGMQALHDLEDITPHLKGSMTQKALMIAICEAHPAFEILKRASSPRQIPTEIATQIAGLYAEGVRRGIAPPYTGTALRPEDQPLIHFKHCIERGWLNDER